MENCSTCGYSFSSKSCPNCRKIERAGRPPGTCGRCGLLTILKSNGQCPQCLKQQELKECLTCREVLPAALSFQPKKGSCDSCRQPHTVRERGRASALRRAYGISMETYKEMEVGQGGRCLICGDKRPLVVDHNHRNGKVRGLLCKLCNVALGFLRDSPKAASRAAGYLSSNGDLEPAGDETQITRLRHELEVARGVIRSYGGGPPADLFKAVVRGYLRELKNPHRRGGRPKRMINFLEQKLATP